MLNFTNARTAQITTLQVGPLSISISTPVMAGHRRMGTHNLLRCTKVQYTWAGPNYCDFTNGGREWRKVWVREAVSPACSDVLE